MVLLRYGYIIVCVEKNNKRQEKQYNYNHSAAKPYNHKMMITPKKNIPNSQ